MHAAGLGERVGTHLSIFSPENVSKQSKLRDTESHSSTFEGSFLEFAS